MPHASDRKFTEVYVCKNYQNRPCFDEVIAKIEWRSFFWPSPPNRLSTATLRPRSMSEVLLRGVARGRGPEDMLLNRR